MRLTPSYLFLLQRSMRQIGVAVLSLCLATSGGLLRAEELAAPAAAADTPVVAESAATPVDVIVEVLLAEIAIKRQKPRVALAAYADLALKYNDPALFKRTVEVAAMNRQPELMLEAARLWVDKEPDSPEALNVLSSSQLALGLYADAQRTLSRYLALLPADRQAQELLRLEQKFPVHADPKQVYAVVQGITAPYAAMPEAQLIRAQAALRAGDDAAALAATEQVRRLRPSSEPAVFLEAQVLAKRSPAAALNVLASYLAAYPNAAPIRVVYAQQLLKADRFPEGRVQLQYLVAQSDIGAEALFAAAALSVQAQDPALAIQALQRLQMMDRVDPSLVAYNLGLSYESLSEQARLQSLPDATTRAAALAQAESNYRKVLPGEYYVTARLRAATLLTQQGDFKAAMLLLQSSTATDAVTRAELTIGEATLLREQGDVAGATSLLDAALKKDPESVLLRYERGMLAERAGNLSLFERSMREVIRRDPKYAQAYNALGFTYVDRNMRLPEARKLLEKALSLAPDDAFILDSMGWLCYREKHYTAALDWLNRAAALRLDPEIIQHQVIVLVAMGRQVEAAQVWRVGMQQFPANESLQQQGKALGLESVAVPTSSENKPL